MAHRTNEGLAGGIRVELRPRWKSALHQFRLPDLAPWWMLSASAVFYIATHFLIARSIWPVHGTSDRAVTLVFVDLMAMTAWVGSLLLFRLLRYRGSWLILALPAIVFLFGRPSVFHALSDPAYLPDGGHSRAEAAALKAQNARRAGIKRVYPAERMTGIVPPNATADRANGRSLLPRTIGGWLPVIAPLVMVFGFMLGCRERLLSWIREQLAWWFGATFLLFTILSAFASNGRVRGTTPWEFFLPLFVIGWATTLADDSYNISRRTVLRLRVLLQLAIYGALPVSLFVFNPGTRDLGIAVVLAASFAAMLVVGTRRGWWAVIMGFVWIALVLAAFRFDDRSATRLALAYAPYRDPATMSVNAASEWAAKVHQIKLFDANIQAGGLIGAGPGRGHGETAPNAADDGVFTLFASQWGWIGALSLVVLYSALLIHALEVAARERSAFDRCVVTGLTMMIGVPFWLASLGAVRVLPLTGVAAGFVAHGGSKLVASSLAIGLIAAISHRQSQTVASDRDVETAPVMNIKTVIAGR